jgi:hypothetical protein
MTKKPVLEILFSVLVPALEQIYSDKAERGALILISRSSLVI